MKPQVKWKWLKWTFGFWSDPDNYTIFGIDIGPLEIVWKRKPWLALYMEDPNIRNKK